MFKCLWPEYSTAAVRVYIVDGQEVRDALYQDFTEGGNDQVYGGGPLSKANFIPAGEIWVEADGRTAEMVAVLVHELAERQAMQSGMKYEESHATVANAAEAAVRTAPNTADAAIRALLAQQKAAVAPRVKAYRG